MLLCFSFIGIAQTATIKGVILDEANQPISDVSITISGTDRGTTSNENGFYILKIPASQDVRVVFNHLSHERIEQIFNLKNGQELEFNPVMKEDVEQIGVVVINTNTRQQVDGVTSITPEVLRTIKGAQPGVENILKTLPSVNISNELSTQYSVRGGNFDENLAARPCRPGWHAGRPQAGLCVHPLACRQRLGLAAVRIPPSLSRRGA